MTSASRSAHSARAAVGRHLPSTPPTPKGPAVELAPASSAQRYFWIVEQLGSAGPALHSAEALEFDGPLDTDALRLAFHEITRRHSVLRSTVVMRDGALRQEVQPCTPVPLSLVDLSGPAPEAGGDPDGARGGWLRHPQARQTIEDRFDLAEDLPLRVAVFRLPGDRSGLLVVVHHIAFDMAASSILLGELAALYGAYEQGAPSPLPALPVQYAELAARREAALTAQEKQEHLAYWTKQLADLPAPLDLTLGAPRPRTCEAHGDVLLVPLGADMARAVHALARREHVSVFAVTLAAYCLLLAARSGSRDLLVAVPHLQRDDDESDRLVGCFLTMLMLRVVIAEDTTVSGLVQHVWDVVTDALDHGDLPLDVVAQTASRQWVPGYRPLAQAGFTAAEDEPQDVAFGPLQATRVAVDRGWIAYDLMVSVRTRADQLEVAFEYCTDLLDRPTVQAMAHTYAAALGQMADAPHVPLSSLRDGSGNAALLARPTPRRVADLQATHLRRADASDEAPGRSAARLAELWKRVLDLEQVAPSDDFFALGGRSLTFVNLNLLIEETFTVSLPLDEFLEATTLAEQSRLIDRLQGEWVGGH